jgi:hypothetical protein
MHDGDDDEVALAIIAVHQKLHELGYDVSGSEAAEVFSTAMQGAIDHVTDPRKLGGAIAGPGGPFDFGENVIDASQALIVDTQDIAKVDPEQGARGQEEVFVVMFSGRINQTPDRASVMLMGDTDFLAATITEMHGVAERAGLQDKLHELCQKRWNEMPHRPDTGGR